MTKCSSKLKYTTHAVLILKVMLLEFSEKTACFLPWLKYSK